MSRIRLVLISSNPTLLVFYCLLALLSTCVITASSLLAIFIMELDSSPFRWVCFGLSILLFTLGVRWLLYCLSVISKGSCPLSSVATFILSHYQKTYPLIYMCVGCVACGDPSIDMPCPPNSPQPPVGGVVLTPYAPGPATDPSLPVPTAYGLPIPHLFPVGTLLNVTSPSQAPSDVLSSFTVMPPMGQLPLTAVFPAFLEDEVTTHVVRNIKYYFPGSKGIFYIHYDPQMHYLTSFTGLQAEPMPPRS